VISFPGRKKIPKTLDEALALLQNRVGLYVSGQM